MFSGDTESVEVLIRSQKVIGSHKVFPCAEEQEGKSFWLLSSEWKKQTLK